MSTFGAFVIFSLLIKKEKKKKKTLWHLMDIGGYLLDETPALPAREIMKNQPLGP